METLKRILLEALNSELKLLRIDCNVPYTYILIHDTRTMFYYGSMETTQMAFTLSISINVKTKKGQKVELHLSKFNYLQGFIKHVFERNLYIKDFGTNVEQLVDELSLLFDILRSYQSNESLKIMINGEVVY